MKDNESGLESIENIMSRIKNNSEFCEIIPWDSDLFGFNIAEIINPYCPNNQDFDVFMREIDSWCAKENIKMLGVRVSQSSVVEINSFENNGFNFIELNFKPYINLDISPDYNLTRDYRFVEASAIDLEFISMVAGGIYSHGRYHQDPNVDNDTANQRYSNWVKNISNFTNQKLYKCINSENDITAFFLINHDKESCFLSLVGILPGFQGKGLSVVIWKEMLMFFKSLGFSSVATSISSHNLAVMNLYVKLGFRFPEPLVTLHKWYE